jgi:hypothetical protein
MFDCLSSPPRGRGGLFAEPLMLSLLALVVSTAGCSDGTGPSGREPGIERQVAVTLHLVSKRRQ